MCESCVANAAIGCRRVPDQDQIPIQIQMLCWLPLLSPKNSLENRKYKGKSEHKNGKVFNSKWEANWIAHKLFKGHTNFKDSFGNQSPDLFIIIHFISLRSAFVPLLIYIIKCVIHVVCAIPMNGNPINVSAVCYKFR